uniref:ATP synthase subunit a n=1 Tax=Chlorotetraedron incus TaxID=162317 RepID=A0A076VFZ2_9CHLO|nr:ATP synthase F0 subunit 6 [Chlorotetraedron incus]AIK29115.1 ATP synthase F0 subunit 6 [Chlorotetraedron incus]
MTMYELIEAYSSSEAWLAVPLVSFNFPALDLIFGANVWAVTAALAILIAIWSNPQNHAYAQAGNSALAGLRKAVSIFWNGQVLERVHLKWRDVSTRNAHSAALQTNRLTAAWISYSPVQRKTTGVWVTVLFFVLLASNGFGLVPLCQAVTGQAGTTLGLSIALLTAITLAGMQRLKLRFVKLFLPSGPSWPMAPLFILLESVSYSFRAISLGVRLWANLFSGHLLLHLFARFALVPVFSTNVVLAAPITALAAGLLMALTGLETMVAILQSGVFGLLASFYLTEVLSKRDPLAKA